MPATEKKALEIRLQGQLDDSLRLRTKSYAGLYRELVAPPAYDSANAARSKVFMNALLETEGFFRSTVSDSVFLDEYPSNFSERLSYTFSYFFSGKKYRAPQTRAHIFFTAKVGPPLLIDTVQYALSDSMLQALALNPRAIRNSALAATTPVLKKGDRFRQAAVAQELERLGDVFKNNGYFKFIADDLYAEADTVDLSLITIDNDPFDQLSLLEEAQKRKEKPTVKVTIKQRPITDSTKLLQHYIGNVRIFPELELADTSGASRFKKMEHRGFEIYYDRNRYKPGFLTRQSRLEKDSLFRQIDYVRTVNAYNQLGVWQQVTVEATGIRNDTVPKVDFDIRLSPSMKQSLIFELEGSRNTGSDAFATGNLLGLGANIGIRNKNVAREAIQSSTQLRGGIELNPSRGTAFILTRQLSLSHSYSIPKLLIKLRPQNTRLRSERTIINATAGYTERKDYFNLGTINTSIGFESARRNNVFFFSPFNIELNSLTRKPGLDSLIRANPLLAYNFSDGLIVGTKFSFVNSKTRSNKFRYIKLAVEESGGLTGFLFKGLYNDLFRFVKLDAEYVYKIEQPKSLWAFRLMGGYGYSYGENDSKNFTLPFFRQFFAGGPNSMRAWTVRSLGPGSVNDSAFNAQIPAGLRLGDVQLEGNIEYRFNLGTLGGIKLKSALFTDIGNVWYRPEVLKGSGLNDRLPIEFNLSRLYKDLAVAGGTSLRLDFDYFLIRLDYAFKLKNPFYSDINDGWFHKLSLNSGQLQLGINYPF